MEKIKSFTTFEYCNLCEKLYNIQHKKNHLKSKKHKKLLLENNLTNADISGYNLIEFKDDENKSEDNVMYLPVD